MSAAHILGPRDGDAVRFRGLGARFMVRGEQSGGGFALIEHPIEPRSLAAPVHTHAREDEYTYVLEGKVGFEIGDERVLGREGDLVFKPRGVPHAFWNPTDRPARALEIVSPAGFEQYFEELAPLIEREGGPDYEAMAEVRAKYGLEMDLDSIARLTEEHGLVARA